jgi:hypothetical protein
VWRYGLSPSRKVQSSPAEKPRARSRTSFSVHSTKIQAVVRRRSPQAKWSRPRMAAMSGCGSDSR